MLRLSNRRRLTNKDVEPKLVPQCTDYAQADTPYDRHKFVTPASISDSPSPWGDLSFGPGTSAAALVYRIARTPRSSRDSSRFLRMLRLVDRSMDRRRAILRQGPAPEPAQNLPNGNARPHSPADRLCLREISATRERRSTQMRELPTIRCRCSVEPVR